MSHYHSFGNASWEKQRTLISIFHLCFVLIIYFYLYGFLWMTSTGFWDGGCRHYHYWMRCAETKSSESHVLTNDQQEHQKSHARYPDEWSPSLSVFLIILGCPTPHYVFVCPDQERPRIHISHCGEWTVSLWSASGMGNFSRFLYIGITIPLLQAAHLSVTGHCINSFR